MLTSTQKSKLEQQLKVWQNDLVNLTRRNRLLYFKHAKTSTLELVEPEIAEIWDGLDRGNWGFHRPRLDSSGDPVESEPDELVAGNKAEPADLDRALRNLERAATQALLDTGLSVLYVTFGMLKWIDPDDGKAYETPLVLRPVSFVPRTSLQVPFRITDDENECVLNPALVIKLANDFDIELPTFEDIHDDLDGVLEAVEAAIARRSSWSVERRSVLATFTFHKEAMYRDLVENAELVLASPMIQAIGLGPEASAVADFAFEPISEDQLDANAPSEKLVSVRDADSTQRVCIVAARNGRSFVMDGPPGTGKSQTITNMIAELLFAGRSVLFVSEKAAALEVVHNRLTEAGLAEFVLELHSHKATRKEVAAELGRALETRPRSSARFTAQDETELERAREELNAYAIAVNVRREPFGRSLHDVMGRVAALQSGERGPVCGTHGRELTPKQFGEILDAAGRLSRAWGPVEHPETFLWRSLRDTETSGARQQQIGSQLGALGVALDNLRAVMESIVATTGLRSAETLEGAEHLGRLLSTIEERADRAATPPRWLSDDSIEPVIELVGTLRKEVADYVTASEVARRVGGERWADVDDAGAEEMSVALARLANDVVAIRPPSAADVGWIDRVRSAVASATQIAADIVERSNVVASSFDVAGRSVDLEVALELAELGGYAGASERPEPAWLNPVVQAALREAESVLSGLVQDYRRQRDELRDTFNESVLSLDLVGLRARFRENSGLRKLSGQYRADKRALEPHCVAARVDSDLITKLDAAIEWQGRMTQLTAAEAHHAPMLGTYYEGATATDLERIHRALWLARRALELTGGVGTGRLAEQLALGGRPDPRVIPLSSELRELCVRWSSLLAGELASLGVIVPAGLPLQDFSGWASRAGAFLDTLALRVQQACAETGRSLGVLATAELLPAAKRANDIERSLASLDRSTIELLGPSFTGRETDFDEVEKQMRWVSSVRSAAGEPMSYVVAGAALTADPFADELAAKTRDVHKRWDEIADLFSQPWRARLEQDFRLSIDDGRGLVSELAGSVGQVDEWSRHASSRQDLLDMGFGPIVETLEERRTASADIVGVVERSALERWIDSIVAGDERLRTYAALERDSMVERFRDLDRRQIAGAAAKVINACSERRPTTAVGVAGIIRREAEKRSRHMPIRRLLGTTQEVALSLKPCFMMSPLSVSQFLPPDIKFDVVIFDEASQVPPSEAANCVYRGKQLVVAGDQKQLPPTSFFDRLAGGSEEYDEEQPEDFESVLDACRSSGIPALSLRWHYRSQHESLITYSNYRFYDGRLFTFPGALEAAPDVGVELIRADGVYRRGAGQDNPIEAEKVVERVLFHRRNHPDLTLGVVAFSGAQESAIGAALERHAREHPELNALLSTDRLDGFFVKNLENVQGDERDIIIFSIGYGRDENGRFTEQLGPLGKQGGERRLNVAITRARRRVEVVASITSADFPGTSAALGIRHLQRYLDFADRGAAALALEVSPEGRDTESPFEDEVIRVIKNMGFEPVPQVGVGGFRIDIGVRHPSSPGAFVLGVECDGTAYHSSRVARDRDRLRQEILEGLGWRLHRIWGQSWYRDRPAQERRLQDAIESAIRGESARVSRPAVAPAVIVEIDEVDLSEVPSWVVDYEPALVRPRRGQWEGEFTSPTRRTEIADVIEEIVQAEGPVHEDVVRERVRVCFGIGRMGVNIRDAYEKALTQALKGRRIWRHEDLFLSAQPGDPIVRSPSGDPESDRSVTKVPASERREAIRRLAIDAKRIDEVELRTAVARLFGWKRVGVDIQAELDRDISILVRDGVLTRSGDHLAMGEG